MSRIATIFISLLVIVLLGVFYTWPEYQRVLGLTSELQERNTELRLKKNYFDSVKKADEDLKGYKEEIAKIDSAIPEKTSLPSLLNFINKTASENGLILSRIGKFSTRQSQDQSSLKEIFLEISLAGEYSALDSFLSALEKSSRIIEADSIVFSLTDQGSKESPFKIQLRAYSY